MKILTLVTVIVVGTVIWAVLPQVPNPEPDYATELARADFDATKIQEVWPAATSNERVRAKIIMRGEEVLYEDGPTDMIMNTHSVRKSFLSLLYGIAVDKGMIDLDKTLAELEIDESTPLTQQEKTATIRDLLMFRSGIYLPAEGEHDSQITERPLRESHKPSEMYFTNNFDANALGTIFTQETGYEIGAFMQEFLARPLGMQDFTADNVIMGNPWFWPGNDSLHEMYITFMSARDMARIGAMVAQGGRWNQTQVVPEEWIKVSTSPLSDLSKGPLSFRIYDAFGYIWFVDLDTGTIWTDGYGEHFMMIDPIHNLTLLERNYTGNSYFSVGRWMMSSNKLSQSHAGMIKAYELLTK